MNTIMINGVTLQTILGILVALGKGYIIACYSSNCNNSSDSISARLFKTKEQVKLVDKEKHNVVL